MHFCYASNYRKGQYGHAILSKFPLDEDSKLNLKLEKIYDKEERSVCTAEVILPSGTLYPEVKKVIVASAHLGLKDNAIHVPSMVKKLNYIARNKELFLLGDLNLTPDEPPYSELSMEYNDVLPIDKRYDTFPSLKADKRIDYILSKKGFSNYEVKVENIFAHKIDWSRISDHYPIMITVSPPPVPKTRWEKACDKYNNMSCTIF